jgi:tetratricopeptide (TPR) repeat protein
MSAPSPFTAALLISILGMSSVAPADDESATVRIETAGPVDEWGEPIDTLQPARPRTEEEIERVAAAALVAQGRILLKRGKLDKALRCFQRAHRQSPQTASILNEIVSLAFQLSRGATAARYAVIEAELAPTDAELTTRLARYLTEQMEYERAIGLYERAVGLHERDTENAAAPGQIVLLKREMGRLHFLLQQHEQAAEAFATAVKALDEPQKFGLNEELRKRLLGKPELTYLLFGEAFLEAGRHDAAQAMFQKVHEAKPNEALLSYQLARVDARRGKHQAALKKLDKYLAAKIAAAGKAPYRLLEELLLETGGRDDPDQARQKTIERLAALYQDDPANAALSYELSRLYRESEQWDRASEILEPLTELDPTIDGLTGLIDVYRRQGKIDELLNVLGRTALLTGSLEPLSQVGQALVEDEDTVKRLLAAAHKQRRSDPESLSVGTALGTALVALAADRLDDARPLFRHAFDRADKESKQRVVSTWGLEMFMADEVDEAAAAFRRAISEKVAPDNDATYHFYLAGALELGGHTDAALSAARKAAQLDKDSARYKSRFAWILYHAKRYDEAEEAYEELLEKYDSQYTDADVRDVLRDARLVLSNICIQRDEMLPAEEWLQQVLDEFPEDVGALNDLGYLWVDQNKHLKRSLKMIQIAVDAEPDNVAYRDSLGWAYYRLGRFEEAVRELEKAAASDDDPDGVILDHLGDAHLQAGHKDKALEAWRRAVADFERKEEDELLRATREKIDKHKSNSSP